MHHSFREKKTSRQTNLLWHSEHFRPCPQVCGQLCGAYHLIMHTIAASSPTTPNSLVHQKPQFTKTPSSPKTPVHQKPQFTKKTQFTKNPSSPKTQFTKTPGSPKPPVYQKPQFTKTPGSPNPPVHQKKNCSPNPLVHRTHFRKPLGVHLPHTQLSIPPLPTHPHTPWKVVKGGYTAFMSS